MAEPKSLWPTDLSPSTRRMPEDILWEQALALKRQTRGLLEGSVEVGSQGGWVTLNFFIVAPRLENYAYRLFKLRHKLPDAFKQIEIIVGSKDVHKVSSEEACERELQKLFQSQATRNLLRELLAMSERAPATAEDEEGD